MPKSAIVKKYPLGLDSRWSKLYLDIIREPISTLFQKKRQSSFGGGASDKRLSQALNLTLDSN